jgi:hypothetical protein
MHACISALKILVAPFARVYLLLSGMTLNVCLICDTEEGSTSTLHF